MEDYKKRYEHALENFKKIKAANKDNNELVDFIDYEYPELKESNDERIRKEILEYFKQFDNMELRGAKISEWISWLEKQGEQKPAWSEEDELKWNTLIHVITNQKGSAIFEGLLQEELINWLKSLKERYTWKPSDGQMKQLGWVAEQNKDNMIGKELMSLYQDLKKLKG